MGAACIMGAADAAIITDKPAHSESSEATFRFYVCSGILFILLVLLFGRFVLLVAQRVAWPIRNLARDALCISSTTNKGLCALSLPVGAFPMMIFGGASVVCARLRLACPFRRACRPMACSFSAATHTIGEARAKKSIKIARASLWVHFGSQKLYTSRVDAFSTLFPGTMSSLSHFMMRQLLMLLTQSRLYRQ